ncbi:GMC family oxidoreductase [bacterium]|nr:MAG: GMC family oxidoreductase [bacterium]
MTTRLKSVDVVTIGVGWTGGIVAAELTKAGYHVVGLERGENRNTDPDFEIPQIHDELAYAVRHKFMQDAAKDTYTFRNDVEQTALPIRYLSGFLPGTGLGGAGVHWNGQTWRFLPWDFETRSATVKRYGEEKLNGATSQDWGITYEELEPSFDKFDYAAGIAGKAGNIKGTIQPGGNAFEGPRSREYPNPPMKTSYAGLLFREAAKKLGYHPFPQPSANVTRPYTNPDGAKFGACVYCGYCERFGCEMFAKSSPQLAVIPVAMKTGNYELRTGCNVTKINLDSTGKRAVSVTYVDGLGREFEQPAEMIFLTSFILNNVRLLLVSGVGKPYDPASGEGVIGRNYTYQMNTGGTYFFNNKAFNSFMGAGAMGVAVDDFNGDNFDHRDVDFVGGAYLLVGSTGARPIQYHPVPPGTPSWGAEWKKQVVKYYDRAIGINASGGVQAYRGNYLDLDPTYRDAYGLPLLRITFDWGPNELNQSKFMAEILKKIGKAINADIVAVAPRTGHYNSTIYQSTHNIGGAIMGSDPENSAVNKYLQSWDVHNVFVLGASAFPQNSAYNPTAMLCALAYWNVDNVIKNYVKHPGPLV